jgi:hypothetical protein
MTPSPNLSTGVIAMLVQPARVRSTLVLLAPEIPDRTQNPLPSGEWGINRAAALGVHPEKGLQVYVLAWAAMGIGDKVELLFNDSVVDQHTITQETEVGERVTLWVPPRHWLTGSHTLAYRVTRFNQGAETFAPPLKLYAKMEIPAGQDTEDEEGNHSNLYMFIDPRIISGGVDKDTAEEGVTVTIRAQSGTGIPYPNAAVGDVIRLSWGGVFKESSPLTNGQITDPANNPIEIVVDKATIEEAGDTGDSKLAVTFIVRDLVGNYAEDWCKEIRIEVLTGTSLLDAPVAQDAVNNVLDMDKQGNTDIRIAVWAKPVDFVIGDQVVVTLSGTTQDGELLELRTASQTFDNLPHGYEFLLRSADVRKLTKTQVKISYRVTRGGTPPLRSKGQFVQVIGEARHLAAPIAEDAQNGAINPELSYTRIEIPFDTSFKAGMGIELIWFGTRPDNSSYIPELEWFILDQEIIDAGVSFFITVEGKHLKMLAGGTLKLSYNLLRDDNGDIVKRGSLFAALLNVGEPVFELEKPVVLGEKDGALEPNDLPNGAGKVTALKPMNPTKPGDIVTFTWDGEITGAVDDSIPINALNKDKDVPLTLNAAFVTRNIEPNRGKKVVVTYKIWRAEEEKFSYANPLKMIIGEAQGERLSPAEVKEAQDDVLDPVNVPNGATVKIPANRAENAGDHFYMSWVSEDGQVEHTDDKPITGNTKGKPVEFTVPLKIVQDSLNKKVIVSYRVELFEGGEARGEDYELRVATQAFRLPVASFKEATGPQKDQLNPDDVYPNGATVVIAATAQLRTDDEITVTVEGKTTTTYPHKVLSTEAGKELASIKVAHAFINENDGASIALSYTVKRKVGGTDGPSDPAVYDVRKVIGSGVLKVMGARFNRSTYRASSASRVLSAFNATTGEPLQAQWKYSSGTEWVTAATLRDAYPQELLHVRTADDQITLNPANIIGNGIDTTVTGLAAVVAHRDVGDVVGWGNAAYGASIPSTIITMDDIVEVSCTRSAYAGRRVNGAVVVWGTATEGGSMTGVSPLGFAKVIGNATAFAGLKETGHVVGWGSAEMGGTVPASIEPRTDIIELCCSNKGAFVARCATGQLLAWGHADFGGTIDSEIEKLGDIVEVTSTLDAFAVRRATGHIMAWGGSNGGSQIPPDIEERDDILQVVGAATAFAALLKNGTVVAWGNRVNGGDISEVKDQLIDVRAIYANVLAFTALTSDGRVVTWGQAGTGGDSSAVRDQLVGQVSYQAKAVSRVVR